MTVQGRRKVQNSEGASTKRPWAAWAFRQITTLLNLRKSGDQWPPCPSSSIGPDNGNCNFVATTLYWLIQFSWDKKSNDQQLKRKLFTLCGSLMLSHIVVLSWPSGWELGSWLMITLMKPSLKCNEWRLRTVVSLSVLNIKVVFIKLGNHLMNYDHQRWLFLTSMYS